MQSHTNFGFIHIKILLPNSQYLRKAFQKKKTFKTWLETTKYNLIIDDS